MENLYSKAIDLLCSQGKFYINLGLDRIGNLLNLIDNPQDKIKTIHIAGTNGKGSVCAMLNNILINAGLKVGLYTSPHLVIIPNALRLTTKRFLKLILANTSLKPVKLPMITKST